MALPFRPLGRSPGVGATAANPAPDAVTGQGWRSPTAAPIRSRPTPPAPRPGTPATDPTADAAALAAARRCEAALLDDLLALLAALRRPLDALPERPLSAAALGGALAELERAERGGLLPIEAVEARRRRLLALSGASANLGALLDQRRRGLLPDAGLDARRTAILGRLAPFFAADEA